MQQCGVLLNTDIIVKNRKCCKSCFHKTIRKQPIKPVSNSANKTIPTSLITKADRTIILGHSASGKSYLMNSILNKLNRNDVYIICRRRDQYPNKYINQSTEIKSLEDYRNKTVIFDDMLGDKQSREIDQFFIRSQHQNINVYYISQSWYDLPKNTIRNICSVIMMFKQTAKYMVLYNDVGGLDMDKKEWREICSKAWSLPYSYIQIDKLANIKDRHSIRNVNDPIIICCIPETNPF